MTPTVLRSSTVAHCARCLCRRAPSALLALPLRCEPRLLPRHTALTTTVLRSSTVAHCARCLCRCKEAGHARSPPALLDFLHPPALCPLCVVRCPSLCVGHTTRVGILTTLASNYSLSEVPLDRRRLVLGRRPDRVSPGRYLPTGWGCVRGLPRLVGCKPSCSSLRRGCVR